MLTPWKKSYDQPRQHIKKQRHYFANKGPSSQGYGFSSSHVWIWQLDLKKAKHWRIDAFELWCWRRLLRVPWTTRRSNQSIQKGINPEYSLETLILKLKFQFFGHLMWGTDSVEKTLMLGKIEGGRRRGRQRMRWLMASPTQWTRIWVSSGSWWWTGKSGVLLSMGSQRVGHDWATELHWQLRSSHFKAMSGAKYEATGHRAFILHEKATLPSSSCVHQTGSAQNPVFLVFYGGFIIGAGLVKPLAFGNWSTL